MRLNCIQCGGAFSVRDEQFGATVACPHCQSPVQLPKVDDSSPTEEEEQAAGPPGEALTNSISGLTSLVIHTLALIGLALVPSCGQRGIPGDAEEVMIGILPGETLSENPEESLDAPSEVKEESSVEDSLEVEDIPTPTETADVASAEFPLEPASISGGGGGDFNLGAVSAGGGGDGGGWDGMLQRLRLTGLDVVIVFDSTGSMGGEIAEVKRQVTRIGNTLIRLVPKARLSLITYRDEGDAYVVKEPILPLTGDIQLVEQYLERVSAGGGGDRPEAVDAGLDAAVSRNEFRPAARKVILLFGDAPPHSARHADCLRIASDFNRQNRGVVSTVTCRNRTTLSEFVEIAQVGGGEAFLTRDEEQIVTQLMILVFGSRYRGKVVEAFELMED